jgi:hypothetical protein
MRLACRLLYVTRLLLRRRRLRRPRNIDWRNSKRGSNNGLYVTTRLGCVGERRRGGMRLTPSTELLQRQGRDGKPKKIDYGFLDTTNWQSSKG